MISKGAFGVELNQEFRAWAPECIFTGSLLRQNGRRRDAGLISEADHEFRGTQHVLVAHDEVQVAIVAHARISITANGKRRPFDDQGFEVGSAKILEEPEQFGRQPKREKRVGAGPPAQLQ